MHSHVAGRPRAGAVLSRKSTDVGTGYSGVYPSYFGWHRSCFYSGGDSRPAVVAYDSKSDHMTLAQWGARVIRWICIHIHVSRSPHYAVHNLTGDTPGRASPDARCTPPHAVWLSAGVPYFTALCRGSKPDGNCGLPVLLALRRVPDRAGVSRRES